MNSHLLHNLCAQCLRIDFSPSPPGSRKQSQKLYANILDLEASAKNGCHLCTLFFSSLTLNAGGTEKWRRHPDGPVKVICKKTDLNSVLYVSCNDFGAASLPFSSFGVESLAVPGEPSTLLEYEKSKLEKGPD